MNFHQNFPKVSQNFPTICSFRPNAQSIIAWLLIFFEKSAKLMHFCNFLGNCFCKFLKFLRRPGGGSAPGPPTRPAITLNLEPITLAPPRNFFVRTPLNPAGCYFIFLFLKFVVSFIQGGPVYMLQRTPQWNEECLEMRFPNV